MKHVVSKTVNPCCSQARFLSENLKNQKNSRANAFDFIALVVRSTDTILP